MKQTLFLEEKAGSLFFLNKFYAYLYFQTMVLIQNFFAVLQTQGGRDDSTLQELLSPLLGLGNRTSALLNIVIPICLSTLADVPLETQNELEVKKCTVFKSYFFPNDTLSLFQTSLYFTLNIFCKTFILKKLLL